MSRWIEFSWTVLLQVCRSELERRQWEHAGVDITQRRSLSLGDRPDLPPLPPVTIKQHIVHLELDSEHSYTAGRHPFSPARTKEHLHIGDVPGNSCADFPPTSALNISILPDRCTALASRVSSGQPLAGQWRHWGPFSSLWGTPIVSNRHLSQQPRPRGYCCLLPQTYNL